MAVNVRPRREKGEGPGRPRNRDRQQGADDGNGVGGGSDKGRARRWKVLRARTAAIEAEPGTVSVRTLRGAVRWRDGRKSGRIGKTTDSDSYTRKPGSAIIQVSSSERSMSCRNQW
jgi:hypothetical protein